MGRKAIALHFQKLGSGQRGFRGVFLCENYEGLCNFSNHIFSFYTTAFFVVLEVFQDLFRHQVTKGHAQEGGRGGQEERRQGPGGHRRRWVAVFADVTR